MKSSDALVLILLFAAAPAFAATPRRASTKVAVHKSAVPFQSDYAKAVAQAKARKVPLFVEAWAPW